MKKITTITSSEAFSVRHPVLRAGKPIESCRFDGDDLPTTTHLGLFNNDNLVGVLSIFKIKSAAFNEDNHFQLRGMAILEDYQKKGFGEQLLHYAENYLKTKNADLIWFNARETAVLFYKKMSYKTVGEAFIIDTIGPHYVMFKKIK